MNAIYAIAGLAFGCLALGVAIPLAVGATVGLLLHRPKHERDLAPDDGTPRKLRFVDLRPDAARIDGDTYRVVGRASATDEFFVLNDDGKRYRVWRYERSGAWFAARIFNAIPVPPRS